MLHRARCQRAAYAGSGGSPGTYQRPGSEPRRASASKEELLGEHFPLSRAAGSNPRLAHISTRSRTPASRQ